MVFSLLTRLPKGVRAAAVLVLLSACGIGPVGNPEPLGDARFDSALNAVAGADGTRLAVSYWPPADGAAPRAVILGVHGYGDFGPSTFDPAARAWAEQGIATYAYDQRGFGRNESRRRWPGAEILIQDLIAVAALIRERHPGVPLTVAGHSMGGGVTLAAGARGLDADGLVLAAPAIAGGELDPFRRAGAWALAAISGDKRYTGKGIVRITPTDNVAIRRQVTSHPLHFGNPSGRELFGLIRVMDRAWQGAPRVTTPTLTLMGANDQILPPAAIERAQARIAGNAEYKLYPDGWHWLFRDLQAPNVWADVAAFALAR